MTHFGPTGFSIMGFLGWYAPYHSKNDQISTNLHPTTFLHLPHKRLIPPTVTWNRTLMSNNKKRSSCGTHFHKNLQLMTLLKFWKSLCNWGECSSPLPRADQNPSNRKPCVKNQAVKPLRIAVSIFCCFRSLHILPLEAYTYYLSKVPVCLTISIWIDWIK